MKGGGSDYLDKTDTESECASLVIARKSSATGATWGKKGSKKKRCWAEYGNSIKSDSKKRACLFTAGNNF